MNIPTGKVTFLFTDIEGSTRLAQDYPSKLPFALEKHNMILKEVVESNNGFVFEIIGDAFCCAFENASDAVISAHEIQVRLSQEKWDDFKIKIRIGIHSGNGEWNGKKYSCYITLARTQRVMSAAYGGQILLSDDAYLSAFDNIPKSISFRDLGERRLKDLKQPIRIYMIVSEKLESDFPPLKTIDARPNNLPIQLTSFIGREEETQNIKDLLDNNSLLTLMGPGGSGKTRLALQIAAESIDNFENGVWFLDTSPLLRESMLYGMAAKVFGIKEEKNKETEDSLIDYLKDKEILLILDNCEHIIKACSEFAQKILAYCNRVKIIAASRELLRIWGEQIIPVSSLTLPELSELSSKDNISDIESVKLFVERAQAVNQNFEITDHNYRSIADICIKLDGIPLAIELAASRVKVLTPDMIRERLSNRFKLLVGGIRTALPRHKTLKATVDWSYDLLFRKEKLLLSRLSVFSDGWTLEAAEEVCSCEILLKEDILELLTQLVDKSLITSPAENERFHILETIREYGEEKLVKNEEIEKILIKHLTYFSDFAMNARKELEGPDQKKWMDNLEAENFNFQTAFATAVTRDHRDKGIQLALNLSRFWEARGYISEAKSYLEELIDTEEEISPELKGKAYQWLGTFNWITGEYEKAQYFYEENHSINKKSNDKRGIAVSLTNLGIIAYAKGNFEKSKKLAEESYAIFEQLNEEQQAADCLLNLGAPLVNLGEIDYARKVFEKSLKIYKKIKDIRGIAMALNNLALLSQHLDDFEAAGCYLEESLSILKELGEKRTLPDILNNLSLCFINNGNYSKAEDHLNESIEINSETGNKKVLADSKNYLGFVMFHKNEIDKSLILHKESLDLRMTINNNFGICNSLIGIAESLSGSDPAESAELIGVLESTIKSLEHNPVKIIQAILDRTKDSLFKKLGEKEFLKYSKSGNEISLEKAAEKYSGLNDR